MLSHRQNPVTVPRDYWAQNVKHEAEKSQQTPCSNQKQGKRSSQKISRWTGLQLRSIKACRTGFYSSREEVLITDHEGREKETSFARWEFQSPKLNDAWEKDPFSRLISGILRMLLGKSDMFFLQIWWLQETPGNIFRQTWHLSTAHLPSSVRDHISGLHLYSLKATGFSPLSFYGATGQDNILRNNKLT